MLRSKAVSIGKLEDDHQITTTWILNPTITEHQIKSLVNDLTKAGLNTNRDSENHLKVQGSALNFNKLFNINLHKYQLDDHLFHASNTEITIPDILKDKVIHVLGLNTSRIARPYVHILNQSKDISPHATTTFTPLQLATLYNFPTGLDGTGQKVGIIELGGGYTMSDLITYFSQLGIQGTPNVTSVSVDGAVNNPNDTSGASVEVLLDIEIIMAIVPKAALRVYFGPNSDRGFYDAINQAINDGCNIISISWGAPEVYWTNSTMTSYNNLFQTAANNGVTIFCAAGDNGSSDGASGNNVDFPGSAPYAVSCGGTKVVANAGVTAIISETVWNINSNSATGGGISAFFSKPSYQNNITFNSGGKRSVPDISGDADPSTGYNIYVQGNNIVVGGTSAVSPLLSSLTAKINQSLGHSIGFIHPTVYSNPNVFRDIIQGNNGAYTASSGWDACTGLGSPNGQLILNLFSGNNPPIVSSPIVNFSANVTSGISPLTVSFNDSSTNSPTSWSWNFGDNTTSILQNPSHTYQNTGTFTVSLTAGNTGGSNTITKTNYIIVNNPPVVAPIANFSANVTSGTTPLTVNFSDLSSNNPTSWLWNFGDNTTSTLQNPSKTYQNAGNYTVKLTASNTGGSNIATKTNFITVNAPQTSSIKANFTANITTIKKGNYVFFTDNSTGSPSAYEWNFGDKSKTTVKNPYHKYTQPGKYTITLKVTKGNTSDIMTKTNYITVTN